MKFAVDGVSVETVDVMRAICQFLDGKEAHTGAVDNKDNVNNYCYKIIGGSFISKIGNLVVDANILPQSGVSQYLIKIKDFAP